MNRKLRHYTAGRQAADADSTDILNCIIAGDFIPPYDMFPAPVQRFLEQCWNLVGRCRLTLL